MIKRLVQRIVVHRAKFTSRCLSTSVTADLVCGPEYIVRETRHYTSADKCPELIPDLIRLYAMNWCPFAQRTRLSLAHKRIRHEIVNVSLASKPLWLYDKNPSGTVPLIEVLTSTGVERVVGSLECVQWAEEKFPETPKLLNLKCREEEKSEAALKGLKEANQAMMEYTNRLPLPRKDHSDDGALVDRLQTLDQAIGESPYIAGDRITITDFMIWPSFERLLVTGIQFTPEQLPNLSRWLDTIQTVPAIRAVRNTDEGYINYWQTQKQGQPVYDCKNCTHKSCWSC